jgi:hypothetical protein
LQEDRFAAPKLTFAIQYFRSKLDKQQTAETSKVASRAQESNPKDTVKLLLRLHQKAILRVHSKAKLTKSPFKKVLEQGTLHGPVSRKPARIRQLPSIEPEIGMKENRLPDQGSLNDGLVLNASSDDSETQEKSLSISFELKENKEVEFRQTKLKMLRTKYNMKWVKKDLQSFRRAPKKSPALENTMFDFGFGRELLNLIDLTEN